MTHIYKDGNSPHTQKFLVTLEKYKQLEEFYKTSRFQRDYEIKFSFSDSRTSKLTRSVKSSNRANLSHEKNITPALD
jgi:hypothetical protein